jgi:hypothetical protein
MSDEKAMSPRGATVCSQWGKRLGRRTRDGTSPNGAAARLRIASAAPPGLTGTSRGNQGLTPLATNPRPYGPGSGLLWHPTPCWLSSPPASLSHLG